MRIEFLGAARQVTGSCYRVEAGGRNLLVDCGLYQERAFQSRNWDPTPTDVSKLDAVLLTHAHLDHCGLLPKLVREGFHGPIYTTSPSVDLAKLVIEDSARIQQEDVATKRRRHRREGRKGPHPYVPLYTVEDAAAAASRLRAVRYGEPIDLGGGVVARLRDAGHILGSASVEIAERSNGRTRRLVFSGDLGQPEVPIVCDPAEIGAADVVVVESTYGDRDHQRLAEIEDQLEAAILETVQAGGNVVIPTFAIDRAQQLMLHLAELLHAKRVPEVMAFLDSPMAVNATEIYRRHVDFMDDETREALTTGHLVGAFGWLERVRSATESKAINRIKGSCLIMAGSGMCTGGRIKHHLVWNIARPESTILFAGYQAEGTLGRQIVDGAPEVRILGKTYPVRARIRQIQGLSAHAGRADLLAWLETCAAPPRRVVVTHGEESAALALAERIRAELGCEVSVPAYRERLALD